MTTLAEIFGPLDRMSLAQLLAVFVACIGYGFAQGNMLGTRGRTAASASMVVGIAGFVALGSEWVSAVMLTAFALATFGAFTAAVWLICRVLDVAPVTGGVESTADAAEVTAVRGPAEANVPNPVASRTRITAPIVST